MKELRTILAVALVLCLMAGLMPMAAFADEAIIEENAGETGSTVTEVVSSPAADAGSGSPAADTGETGSAVTEVVSSPAADAGSGNAGSGNGDAGANASSAGSGEAGSTVMSAAADAGASDNAAVENAAAENAADNGAASDNAAESSAAENGAEDSAAPAKSAPDSGLPQVPEAFAASAPEAPVAPAEPDLTGLSDEAANEKIRQYNSEVALYNEAVEQYNAEFDAYEAAAAEYNASVESFNESAANYNAKADEHNRAEQKKLDDYQAAMDNYNQKAGAYNDYQKKIDAVSDRNMAKAEDQMKSLGDIRRLDKESILSLGTVLEEDYTVNYGWRSSTLGHAGDLVISWDDLKPGKDHSTIRVQKDAESDETYKVANLHIFEDFADFNEMNDYQSELGWDCMNINVDDANGVIIIPKALIDRIAMIEIDVAEVGKNDTVTVLGQNNIFTSNYVTTVGRFFEGYSDGPYWYSAGTVFQSTAKISESDWTGTGHTFSYSDGTTDRAGIKNPLNVNHYVFQRYPNPNVVPERPEEVTADMMEKAENLSLIEILGARLSRLLGLSEREIKAKEDPVPAAPVIPEENPVQPVPIIPTAVEIPDEPAPLAGPEQEEEDSADIPTLVSVARVKADAELGTLVHHEYVEEIADDETPLASGASWALVNLVACLLTALLTIVCLVNRHEKEDAGDEKKTRIRLGLVIPAAVSVILFILTEDVRNPMITVDVWTPVMLVILVVNCVLCLSASRRSGREKSRI